MKKLTLIPLFIAATVSTNATAESLLSRPGAIPFGGIPLEVICRLLDRFHDVVPPFCREEPEFRPVLRPIQHVWRTTPIPPKNFDFDNPIPNPHGFPGYHFPLLPDAAGAYVFEVTLTDVVSAKKLSEEEICDENGCVTNTTYQVLVGQPSVSTMLHPVEE